MAYRSFLVVGLKREISLHPLRGENFLNKSKSLTLGHLQARLHGSRSIAIFQKLFGQFHKSLYLCTAVPVVPLPDIQVLVMNPGFFIPVCLLVAKIQKILYITAL